MPAVHFLLAGPIDRRTGGSIYDRRMAESLRARGWSVTIAELPGPFPEPDSAGCAAAVNALSRVPSGATVLWDGLAAGALPDLLQAHRDRVKLVALVHLPLASAAGLDAAEARRLAALEQRALSCCRAVVFTGNGSRAALERYGVPADRLWLVEPGTDPAPVAAGSDDGRLRLLCVANVHAGKGHDLLVRALASLPTGSEQLPPWCLTCAGSLTHDERFAAELQRLLSDLGLGDRVTLAGELNRDALEAAYSRCDLFVLATRQETYGMAVAEAVAHGLPVVSTDTGAIAWLLAEEADEAEDGGIVVPPGDEIALAHALGRVMSDPQERSRLRRGARHRRANLPTWDTAAAQLAAALTEVARRG